MKKIKIVFTSIFFLLVCMFGFSLSVCASDTQVASFNYPKEDLGGLSANQFVRSSYIWELVDRNYYGMVLVAAKKSDITLNLSKFGNCPTALIQNYKVDSNGKKALKTSYGWSDDETMQLDNYVFSQCSLAYNSDWSDYVSFDCDIVQNVTAGVSTLEALNALKPYLIDPAKFDPGDTGDNTEPPKFYLKTYNDYGMNKYSEYTLTWDTKGSFVEGKESDYGFKVYIAKENKPSDAKVLESTELSPCLFSANSLVFTWQDVKDLFSFLSTSKLENRFDVFVQITDKSGKAVSDNYIHFLVVKRMEIRDSNYVDKDGNEQKSYGKWENGQFEYTDGRETSADDKTTNSNGSSTAPSSNVKNDGYTNAENAPSSSNFDASATKSLIKTLDTIVTTLGDVPALLANVYSWLPVEIITLIGTGIGLIVVVGIAKWLL